MTESSFTIIEKISDGPNAVVYKARQNALNRNVLLKRLQHHLLSAPEARARFMREAQACAMLKSDYIVHIYDVTEFENAPAIVMEYVEGRSLDQIISSQGHPDAEFVTKVARSVLEALSYAHAHGIIHRDVKPGNILIASDGRVKVTDFGIAAIVAAPSLTAEGSLMGTPAYMSPEQARGEGIDQRTDLFSLGASLVELCTGAKLFDGRTYTECLTKILSFNETELRRRLEGVPRSLQPLFSGLLAPEKSARYANADEALKFFESGSIPRRRGRRWSRLALAGGGILTLAAATSLVISTQREPVRRSPPPADSTRISDLNSSRKIINEPHETDVMRLRPIEAAIPRSAVSTGAATSRALLPSTVRAIDSGYVSITCRPWGKVFIDNQFIETTPIAGTIKLPAGSHVVTFTNPDFAPVVKSVLISKNEMSSVDADFVALSGYLFLTVDPWAEVYVDDQYRDTTPLNHAILVSAGRRKIRLHNPRSQDITKTVDVRVNDTLRLEFKLQLAAVKK